MGVPLNLWVQLFDIERWYFASPIPMAGTESQGEAPPHIIVRQLVLGYGGEALTLHPGPR